MRKIEQSDSAQIIIDELLFSIFDVQTFLFVERNHRQFLLEMLPIVIVHIVVEPVLFQKVS